MTFPNRPPSCDKLKPAEDKPVLKECPFCGSTDVRPKTGYSHIERVLYVGCNACGADGPWGLEKAQFHWNSIPRRSEVSELLRLVDGLRSSVNTGSPEWYAAYATLMTYADKLRKEWKL